MIGDFLYRITEPLLRPIRSMLPNLGGIDVSPVILILLILSPRKRHRPLYLPERVLTWHAAAARG